MSGIPESCDLRVVAQRCAEVFAGKHWCIAGGAVRDTLMGVQPKDFDVFVMAPEVEVAAACIALPDGEPGAPEPFLVGNYLVSGLPVQVMAMPHCTSMLDVLDGFDWQVSRFAFDGDALLRAGQLPERGACLELHQITYAASSWRRGVRFAARFDMRMRAADIVELTSRAIDDAGPGGDQ